MAVTDTTLPEQATGPAAVTTSAPPGELEALMGTGDHASLGRMYIGFSLLLLAVGLAIRLIVGLDLATDSGVLGSYLSMVDVSSLIVLVFLGVLPSLVGLAMVIVPLQIGSPSIAFPRAAALSLWAWLVSAGIFVTSVALDGGVGGGDYDAAALGNISLGVMMASLGLAAVCVATTVLTHRPAGMSLARVPLFAWSMLVAASVWIVTFGAALAYTILGHISTDSVQGLLENYQAGLAWLLRGPAIYMIAIPVLGIAGDAVAHTTGRPLRNYGVFQGLIGAFGILSFGAWAIGPGSIDTLVWVLWALAVALPVLGLLAGLGESLRHGRPKSDAGLVGSLLALLVLLGGMLVGAVMALDTAGSGTLFDFEPAALARAQSLFVIAAAVIGLVAGSAHWSPQIWGARSNSSTVIGAALLLAAGGMVLGLTHTIEVFLVANGTDASTVIGILSTLGALGMCIGVLGALAASLASARTAYEGGGAGPSQESGLTLEWQVPWPAVGAERTAALPDEFTSPYPFATHEEDS